MKQTLGDELQKLINKENKRYQIKEDDLAILTTFFEKYYGGMSDDKEKTTILHASIENILNDNSEFIFNIIEGVKSFNNDKCKLSERLEKLLIYLKDKYRLKFNPGIFENFKINDKNTRLLKMLKYLHAGGKTRDQIAGDFGVSERTVTDDLAVLQDGFNFLGTEMKISKLERGSNKYKSIIHPVFLAMNSAEIYSLTVGLKLLSKGTVFEDSLGRIANAVYEQLSQTSKDMIDEHVDDTVNFRDASMKFIDSRNLGQLHNRPFTYFLKEPVLCKIFYTKDGEDSVSEAQGVLRLAEPTKGNIYDVILLENEEGTIVLQKDQVIRIERLDKDKYFKDW